MRYSLDGLGQVIEDHRTAKGMTQAELGDRAGYKAGAGVSISRIESGLTHPRPDRFAGIAGALDLTPAQLEAAAIERTRDITAGKVPPGRNALRVSGEDLATRAQRLVNEGQHRDAVLSQLDSAFAEAHSRSCEQFFMPLVEISGGVDGVVQPMEPVPDSHGLTDAQAEAAARFRLARGGVSNVLLGGAQYVAIGAAPDVGRLAAYGTLRAVVAMGRASTDARISELHGAARYNAANAVIGGGTLANGGGGIAAGERRLAGIAKSATLAIPIVVSIVTATRRALKDQKLAAELEEYEAELKASKRGFEAAADIIPRAVAVLDDIAVHGTRALNRWTDQLGPLPWGELDPANEQRYRDFVDLSACHVVVGSLDFQALLERTGEDREALIAELDEIVNRAEETVAKLV